MSQTILIEDDKDLKDVLSLNLNAYVGTDVIIRADADDAINLLKILPTIDLIIVKNSIKTEKTSKAIYDYVKSANLEIPLIILGEDNSIPPDVEVVLERNWQVIVKKAAKILGVTAKEMVNRIVADYFPIPIDYFFNLDSTCCDIYIRIKKSPNESQFVKRIHKNDTFDRNAIQKYVDQGLKEFFVGKDDRLFIVNYVTTQLVKKLSRKDLSHEERVVTTAGAYDVIKDQVKKTGISDQVVELAEASIKSLMTSISENPKLKDLLKVINNNKMGYGYKHCHMLALISYNILQNMEWGNKEQQDKMAFVSFFHDITLKDDVHMRIHSEEELNGAKLNEEDLGEVNTHAKKAAKLLMKYPNVPLGADTIIQEHHGSKSGVGFTTNYNSQVSPLSIVFLIAEDITNYVIDTPEEKLDLHSFCNGLQQKYILDKYRKTLQAFVQSLDKAA